MSSGPGMIGVVLLRDEDLFAERAVRNILPLCDRVLAFDHGSRDRTLDILNGLAAEDSRLAVSRIKDPAESHAALEDFAGRDVWVFAVDGDEIYDPVRTAVFFKKLRAGSHQRYFRIKGNVLHCDRREGAVFSGFPAPPSRSMTKLYNFAAIEKWTGGFERLHGGEMEFRDGFDKRSVLDLGKEHGFSDSPFRCLHLVFLRRSSRQPEASAPRLNIADRVSRTRRTRATALLRKLLRRPDPSKGKLANYRLGTREEAQGSDFGFGGGMIGDPGGSGLTQGWK